MSFIDTKNRTIKGCTKARSAVWKVCDLLGLNDTFFNGKKVGYIRDEDKPIDLTLDGVKRDYRAWVNEMSELWSQDSEHLEDTAYEQMLDWFSYLADYFLEVERVVSPSSGDQGWKLSFSHR